MLFCFVFSFYICILFFLNMVIANLFLCIMKVPIYLCFYSVSKIFKDVKPFCAFAIFITVSSIHLSFNVHDFTFLSCRCSPFSPLFTFSYPEAKDILSLRCQLKKKKQALHKYKKNIAMTDSLFILYLTSRRLFRDSQIRMLHATFSRSRQTMRGPEMAQATAGMKSQNLKHQNIPFIVFFKVYLISTHLITAAC